MGANKHDWRTKHHAYMKEDTELNNPERYAWSEPPGIDQRIITRGIARKEAKMDKMLCRTEIQTDGDETLEVTIKEPEPTAIFLNESQLAWERRQRLLSEDQEIIKQSGRFSSDTNEFDFLQAGQTTVIMAITSMECYVNHKLRQLRERRKKANTGRKAQSRMNKNPNLMEKINQVLPDMMGRRRPSTNPSIKDPWKEFEGLHHLRNELIHATAGKMEAMNVDKPEWVNTWDKTSRVGCPHEIVLKLIRYFEDGELPWLEQFPITSNGSG